MKFILVFLFALFTACQPLPKDVDIDKYKKQFIQGRVDVSEELKNKVPKDGFFVIISVRMLESPMPIAVLRVENPQIPYSFKITGKHKLTHEIVMEGDVILTARISKSPQAEASKGDLIGFANARVGDKNVFILIDREVK